MQEIKKIVIIGPESTGKSTLCKQLAEHYSTLWCPEYAREYLTRHGTKYTYDDLLKIAKGQLALENEYVKNLLASNKVTSPQLLTSDFKPQTSSCKPLFIDTNMYVMKVWCEFVFGKCHQFIFDQIEVRKYDLYLLCNIDLQWVKDDLREYPDLQTRYELYNIYKNIMISQPVPWVDVHGNYAHRKQLAIEAVDNCLKNPG